MFETIFQNTKGYNTCKIHLQNPNETFCLYYHLFDYPVQHSWQKIHQENPSIKHGHNNKINFLKTKSTLKDCCNTVGVSFDQGNITQEVLNDLHHKFVMHREKNIDVWEEINFLIHKIEAYITSPYPEYDSTLNFYSDPNVFVNLNEEMKIFLKTDVSWGAMLLGYDTLGKDWMDVAKNNDCIEDLNIQSTISSQTRLCFTMEQPFDTFQEQKFYKWANTTEIDVPLNNLNALSLGRYPLGTIIITNELLNFHNIYADWYVPNHSCKLRWNKEKILENTKVKKLEFFHSDLYYNTMREHARL